MKKMRNQKNKTKKHSFTIYHLPFTIYLLLFAILLLLPQTVQAATYYCDPVKGNTTTGDGSVGNPWGTLQSVMEAGKFNGTIIKSGDTVKVRTGFHGHFGSKFGASPFTKINTDYITIEADTSAVPDLNFIGMSGCEHWRFKGLRISPSFSNQVEENAYITDESRKAILDFYYNCRYITIEDCDVSTVEDSSFWNANDWTPYEAPGYTYGLVYDGLRSSPRDLIVRGCQFKNVSNGIIINRQDVLIEDSIIQNFSHDGIDILSGPNITIQDNVMIDHYECDIPSHFHADFIQVMPGITADQASNIIIRRNYCNARTDPNRDVSTLTAPSLNGGIQGFYMHRLHDSLVENNVVICTANAWGISVNCDSSNVTIINNTVLKAPGSLPLGYLPQIYFTNDIFWRNNFNCEGHVDTIVRNNISHGFPPDSNHTPDPYNLQYYENVVVDYNFDIDDFDTDEEFINYAYGNIQLSAGSHFVDAGSSLDAPAEDLERNLRPQGQGYDVGAYEYGASTFLYGDVSGNKEISAYDAALTAQYSVGLISLTPEQIKAADVSGNGEVSAYDAALIAQYSVGLISKFPVEGG